MVQRRAVNRADKELQPETLPTLYKTLVPLTAERHSSYFLSKERSYDYASETNAIPITADEFPQAMRNYPIVLLGQTHPHRLRLLGFLREKMTMFKRMEAGPTGLTYQLICVAIRSHMSASPRMSNATSCAPIFIDDFLDQR